MFVPQRRITIFVVYVVEIGLLGGLLELLVSQRVIIKFRRPISLLFLTENGLTSSIELLNILLQFIFVRLLYLLLLREHIGSLIVVAEAVPPVGMGPLWQYVLLHCLC